MQEIHKSRQNSEVKRKGLLAKLALIRTEAVELEAEVQFLEGINKIEQDIKSARVNVRKYQDFLKEEIVQLETVQEALHTIKATKRKNLIDQMKGSVLICLIGFIPLIFIYKLYYLSLIPKHIPISSALIYIGIGDILFYTWIFVCVFYSIGYRYITINYIVPFIERHPPLNIPTRLCSASIFIFLYGQFLLYSASIVPRAIRPSWGPSVVNVLYLIIALLTSGPLNAILALIAFWPMVRKIMKKYKLWRVRRQKRRVAGSNKRKNLASTKST